MKLTLGKKLGLGFGVILALMASSAVTSFVKLADVKQNQDTAFERRFPSVATATALQRDLNETATKCRQAILAGAEPTRRETAKGLFDSAWGGIDKDVAQMDELASKWSKQENRDRLDTVKKTLPELKAVQEAAMNRAASGERDAVVKAGDEYTDRGTPILAGTKKTLGDMSAYFEKALQQNQEEANSATRSMNLMIAVTTVAALAIGIFVAVFLSRRISTNTQSVLGLAEAIAAGDLTREDLKIQSEDELGDLTRAINKVNSSLKTVIASITENAQHVASASEELSATSQQISANSEETSAQAGAVSTATQHVSQNLQSVSTGAEEMTSTIQSIASNAHEAATVASNAVQTAQAANTTVGKLGESSAEIGEVIKVITSIAQQTNLLALNATIEAARAGEAGKGFAVVANEVKELAKQTAKATEDINQVNDISSTIATAVEEQSATTNEMTRNVADAAKGSGEITHNIEGVAEAARGTSSSAQESQKAANELAEMAVQLRGLVDQFRLNNSQGDLKTIRTSEPRRAMAARAGK